MNQQSLDQRRARFRELHTSGCFVIPNPWDAGSARYLASIGFRALATTSSGFAFSKGRPDGGVSVDEVIEHVRAMASATDLPLNVDFEDGHATEMDQLQANIVRCIEAGASGLSIEDATGQPDRPRYCLREAVKRLQVARRAINDSAPDVLLVARAEHYLVCSDDPLRDTLDRLVAFAEAGADCLFAPGLRGAEEIEAVVRAVSPLPVNVLVGSSTSLTLEELAGLGVCRASVGGALACTAWAGFARAAEGLAVGRFDGLADAVPHVQLDELFRQWVTSLSEWEGQNNL